MKTKFNKAVLALTVLVAKEALPRRMHMNAGAFIVLLLLTICQVGSIHAQTVPWITWIRQYGTKYAEISRGISAEGNIYVAGYTNGVFPGQVKYDPFGNTLFDAYVAKYDPDGNQLWVSQFGTSGDDQAMGIAIDGSGVYVTGYTDGTLPGQTNFGSNDAFIKKYDHSGNELWTRQFGTAGTDLTADAVGVDVDATGVYVIGTTSGAFPGYANAGGKDFFIAKYSPNGTQLWLTQKGTSGADNCTGICVDALGLYICGYDNHSGQYDAFISKYSLEGNEVWTTPFGTTGVDLANEISVNETALYVSGNTNGIFPEQTYAGGSYDVFAAKYDLSGNQLWIREFGTTKADYGFGISVNTSDIYIAGYTDGVFPGQTNAGSSDVFIAKYNQDGNPLWIKEIGSASQDYAWTISVVSSYAYVNGYTNGTLPGQTSVGGSDAFLIQILLVDLPPVADCGDDQVRIVTETVQLDGSGSSDPNGLAITYSWSIISQPEGSSAALSNSTAMNPTFEADVAGDYQVQLIVNDGTFNSNPCLVTITVVQTPQEATQYLIADVQELVNSEVLTEDQGNGLIDKLQAAIQNMNQEKYNPAINNLNAFINQVNAFHNAGILSDEEANALIVAAERIIDFLENLLLKRGGVIASGDLSIEEYFQTWNYPNPFNFSTTIHYSLPADLFVTLTIYDPSGKEVSVLVNSLQSMGTHTLTLFADGLSGGIYYYRLQAGSFSAMKKLIVLQ